MGIEVRPVRPDEYAEAGQVTALAYREFVPPGNLDWQWYLERIADVEGRVERTRVLVAVEDGRILGTATLELSERIEDDDPPLGDGESEIRMLGVHPDARGRGVGRALMDALIQEARRAGKRVVSLHTTPRMRTAQKMYEGMGFHRGPDRVFDDGFVLMSYSMPLADRAARD